MSLTIQTIENEEKWIERSIGNAESGNYLMPVTVLKDLLSAARWAIENGYRDVSTERVSLHDVIWPT